VAAYTAEVQAQEAAAFGRMLRPDLAERAVRARDLIVRFTDATGLPRDYCRRIIYAGIQVEYFYEVPGGFTIAPSIRRRNRKYINSLDELERAARRQIIVASGEDEHGTY